MFGLAKRNMNNFFRHKTFFTSAAIFGSCFFFSACENDPKVIKELTQHVVLVEEAKNIETYLSQGSVVKAKLWAPYMLRYTADTLYVEFPRSLHVNFFDSMGKQESHLDARYGKYFESLNKVYLRDSVLVYNMQGDTLRCPELWWDQNTQLFYTDKNVWIKKSGTVLLGKGMDAKQDLSNIHITEVKGTVIVPDSLSAQ
jgi:LPS export ABC transporter protein LptC